MPNNSAQGLFITIEGGEGAGKSSLMESLALKLRSSGYKVLATREPGGSTLGETIREWLLHSSMPIAARAELLLFLAARSQHLHEKILPALKRGEIVLCDRFNDSTIAYQGYGRGLDVEDVTSLCDLACDGKEADLTLFVDVDPSLGLQRAKRIGEPDRMEKEEIAFHKRVRHGLQSLALESRERYEVLDGSDSQEAVSEKAFEILTERLLLRGMSL